MAVPGAHAPRPEGEYHSGCPGRSSAGIALALKSIRVRSTLETAEPGWRLMEIRMI